MSARAPFPPVDGTQPCAGESDAFFPHAEQENWADCVADPADSKDAWRGVAPATREAWFSINFARDLCSGCPFRRSCLAYALTHDVEGIWGGTTHLERRRLRAQHGITADPVHIPDPAGRGHADVAARYAEVARLDALGLNATQIAERLGVTSATVHAARARNQQSEGATA